MTTPPDPIILDSKGRRCLSVRAAARRLGVSHAALLAAIKKGRLRASRLGTLWLVPLTAVARYKVDRKQQANARGRG